MGRPSLFPELVVVSPAVDVGDLNWLAGACRRWALVCGLDVPVVVVEHWCVVGHAGGGGISMLV